MPAKTRRTRASNHVAWPSPTQSLFGGDSSKARRDQRQEAQISRGKRHVVISLSPTPPLQTPSRTTRSNGSGSNGGSRNTAILVEDDEDEQSDTSDWEPETPPLPPAQGEAVPSKLSVDAEGADDDDADDDDEDDFSTPPPPPGQVPAHSPPPQTSPAASPPPASPSPPSEAAAEEELEAEAASDSEEESEASASPEPQEPRKSIFDIHDQEEEDAMLAQLQALLPGSDEEASDLDDDDLDYEEKRNRRMMKNKAMLLQLGLAASQPEESSWRASPSGKASPALRDEMASQNAFDAADEEDDDNHGEGPSTLKTSDSAPKRKRGRPSRAEKAAERASGRVINKNNARTQLRLGEDGTTTSLPLRGTTHELAYVYLPPPRARDPFIMIDNFLVEAPRPPTPPPPSPSPSPPPVKMRKTAKKMGKRKAVDADGVEKPVKRRKRERERDVAVADGEAKPSAPLAAAAAASAYSTNEGVNCHQCRRKHASPLPMTCRKCRLHYCYGCMDVRYGAYDPEDPDDALYDNCRDTWDSKDTHWRCPKCRGICNCSLCLVKGGYKELLHGPGAKTAAAVAGEKGPAVKKRVTSLSTNTRGPKKEREHRSVRHYLENALGVFKTNKEGTGEDDVAVASDEEGVGPAELPTIAEDGEGVGDGGGRVRHPLRKQPKRGYMTLKRLEEQINAVKAQLREERAKMSSRKVALILVGVDDYSDAEEGEEVVESGLVQPPRRRLTLKLPEHHPAADEQESDSDADGEDDVTAAAIFAATQGPSLFSSNAATEANVWVRSAMDVSDSESDDLMEPEEEEAYGRHEGSVNDEDDDADGDDEEEEAESEDELMDSDDEDEDDEDDDDEVADDRRRSHSHSHSHSVHTAHSRRASAASSILSSASSGLSDPPTLSPLSSRRPSPIPPPPPKPKRLTGRAKSKASWAAPAAAADQSIDSSMDEGDDGQPLVESYGHGNGDDTQHQQRYKLLPIPAPIPSSLRPLNTADATSSPMHPGVASQLQQPSTPGSSSHDEAEIRTRAGTRTRGRVQPTFGWA